MLPNVKYPVINSSTGVEIGFIENNKLYEPWFNTMLALEIIDNKILQSTSANGLDFKTLVAATIEGHTITTSTGAILEITER